MMKILICTIVLFLSTEIIADNLRVELTEQGVTEQDMYTIGTFLKVDTCTRFVFENSVMFICRYKRSVQYDLIFRDWLDNFEDDLDKLWLKMFLDAQKIIIKNI